MMKVPREDFIPAGSRHIAYEDAPIAIGDDQTISQPFIVAIMLSALEVRRSDKVLEVGTGSGYQAALLAELAREVVTVERIESLAASARQRLEHLGYRNIRVMTTGVELGWPELAPFDGIIVAAGAPTLPKDLIKQLAIEEGGNIRAAQAIDELCTGQRPCKGDPKPSSSLEGKLNQTLRGCDHTAKNLSPSQGTCL